MVYFVGAGSGAVDLITVRGQRLLRQADVVIYAGSLVNPQLLKETRPDCRLYNSAKMTLEEVLEVIEQAHREQACIVRLHTGDPCLYGAIREQMDQLDALNIPYEYVPGVSSFCAAAAALNAEYTLPDVSQTVIITRMAGRTPVPEKEEIAKLAAHQATMVIFLSTGLLEGLQQRLMEGGYPADTPAAICYLRRAKPFRCKRGIFSLRLCAAGDRRGQRLRAQRGAAQRRKAAAAKTEGLWCHAGSGCKFQSNPYLLKNKNPGF